MLVIIVSVLYAICIVLGYEQRLYIIKMENPKRSILEIYIQEILTLHRQGHESQNKCYDIFIQFRIHRFVV